MTGTVSSHKGPSEANRYVYAHFSPRGLAFKATTGAGSATLVGPKSESSSEFKGHNVLSAGLGGSPDAAPWFSDVEEDVEVPSLFYPFGIPRVWISSEVSEDDTVVWVAPNVGGSGALYGDTIHYCGKTLGVYGYVLSAALLRNEAGTLCLFYVYAQPRYVNEYQWAASPVFPLTAIVREVSSDNVLLSKYISHTSIGMPAITQTNTVDSPCIGYHSMDGRECYASALYGIRSEGDTPPTPAVANLTIRYDGSVTTENGISGDLYLAGYRTHKGLINAPHDYSIVDTYSASVAQTAHTHKVATPNGVFQFSASREFEESHSAPSSYKESNPAPNVFLAEGEGSGDYRRSQKASITIWDGVSIPMCSSEETRTFTESLLNTFSTYPNDYHIYDIHGEAQYSYTATSRTIVGWEVHSRALLCVCYSATSQASSSYVTNWSGLWSTGGPPSTPEYTYSGTSHGSARLELWIGGEMHVLRDYNEYNYSFGGVQGPMTGDTLEALALSLFQQDALNHPGATFDTSGPIRQYDGNVGSYTVPINGSQGIVGYRTHMLGMDGKYIICVPVLKDNWNEYINHNGASDLSGIDTYRTFISPDLAKEASAEELSAWLSDAARLFSLHPVE